MDLAIGKYRLKISLQRYQVLELSIVILGIMAICFSFLMHSRFFLNHILNQNAVADLIAYSPYSAELMWPHSGKMHNLLTQLLGIIAFIWGWKNLGVRPFLHSLTYFIVGIVLMNLNDAITWFELFHYAKQI
jgi:hypothetical protein